MAEGNVLAFCALYSSKTLKNDQLRLINFRIFLSYTTIREVSRSKFFELVASYQKLHIKERKKTTTASAKINESSVASCFQCHPEVPDTKHKKRFDTAFVIIYDIYHSNKKRNSLEMA